MNLLIQRCDRCGKQVVQMWHADSTDMVEVKHSILYYCDLLDGEAGRPSLFGTVTDENKPLHFCLDCLLYEVTDWVKKMKKRGPSKIPGENVSSGSLVV